MGDKEGVVVVVVVNIIPFEYFPQHKFWLILTVTLNSDVKQWTQRSQHNDPNLNKSYKTKNTS